MKTLLYPQIQTFCSNLVKEYEQIAAYRQAALLSLSDYITNQLRADKAVNIISICTHNSRRSHLAQLWLAVFADYFQLKNIRTYSGGTEATALNPRIVKTLLQTGFQIIVENAQSNNPHYELYWKNHQEQPYILFSKYYKDHPNPTKDFAALLVCDNANEACPLVSSADFRLAHTYKDPKIADDTAQEMVTYTQSCHQIALEMAFVLQQVQQNTLLA